MPVTQYILDLLDTPPSRQYIVMFEKFPWLSFVNSICTFSSSINLLPDTKDNLNIWLPHSAFLQYSIDWLT